MAGYHPKAPTPLVKRMIESRVEKEQWEIELIYREKRQKVSKHGFPKTDMQHFAAVNTHQHARQSLGAFQEETSFISNCIFVVAVLPCRGISDTMGD